MKNRTSSMASCARRPGRNPYEVGQNPGLVQPVRSGVGSDHDVGARQEGSVFRSGIAAGDHDCFHSDSLRWHDPDQVSRVCGLPHSQRLRAPLSLLGLSS